MEQTETAVRLSEHDVVALRRDVNGFDAGTEGTVVSAHPAEDVYTVEVSDSEGRPIDFLSCSHLDLMLLQAARDTHRNGRG